MEHKIDKFKKNLNSDADCKGKDTSITNKNSFNIKEKTNSNSKYASNDNKQAEKK